MPSWPVSTPLLSGGTGSNPPFVVLNPSCLLHQLTKLLPLPRANWDLPRLASLDMANLISNITIKLEALCPVAIWMKLCVSSADKWGTMPINAEIETCQGIVEV